MTSICSSQQSQTDIKINSLKLEIKTAEEQLNNANLELENAEKNLKLSQDNKEELITVRIRQLSIATETVGSCQKILSALANELLLLTTIPTTVTDESTKSILKFWNCIKQLNWKESDQIITLSDGMTWMGNLTQQIKLIRKTWFLYYCIALLAKHPENIIIYQTQNTNAGVLFSKFGVQMGSLIDLYHCIKNIPDPKKGFYLVDDSSPDEYIYNSMATTILVTCGDKKVYTKLEKEYSGEETTRYIPIWSWEEINYCREKIFVNTKQHEVIDLYSKFGGIPRYVLQENVLAAEMYDVQSKKRYHRKERNLTTNQS